MPENNEVDISGDVAELLMDESLGAHEAVMAEINANAESAHSIVRHHGARKFGTEDPIEAAAVETILSGAPINERPRTGAGT